MEFYIGLGYFKAAVIAEGIHARHRQGPTVDEGFETVGEARSAARRRRAESVVGQALELTTVAVKSLVTRPV
ncbi:hypothetical protein [Amycolatopsis thermoflava]|uniref:hypothetical protein n=1 Tax=Amycolatopsis thermoflava TaxID=84480 RepID=UPI001ABFE60B|nr:hypothetical protein [Amycolatopsis thermoflava]